ncbi:MAG: hypothetical protein WD771_10070 [Gemmatimonadaceae bacterium]
MNAPLSGRDTAAAFKGLIVGLVALAVIVLTIVNLTNRKFESHETPAATSTP